MNQPSPAERRSVLELDEVFVSPPVNTPPRILCVDDRVSSLEVRRAMLSQFGYDVLLASDPPSALAILNKVNIDLVVLDYSFPGQMSGEELARQIRAATPEIPLIMLSGYPDLPESAREAVDALILKGAGGPTDLLNAIRGLLEAKRPSGSEEPATRQNSKVPEITDELIQRVRRSQEERREQHLRRLRKIGS